MLYYKCSTQTGFGQCYWSKVGKLKLRKFVEKKFRLKLGDNRFDIILKIG